MIPFARPSVGDAELEAVRQVFSSGWLGMGALVKEFEDEVSKMTGAKNVIAVNSGTSALHIALDALGVGPGDEVILPSLTFAACVQAILATGARPVFCDVERDTLNADPKDVESRITERTRAIMPVHYGGLPCRLDEFQQIARPRGILLVEDAAHAFGSSYKGRKIGTFGHATCFSFDAIKIVTCGEGGAVATEDDGVAKLVQKKRILGIDKDTWSRYRHERSWFYGIDTTGHRYHMSNLNAAIGLAQLRRFDEFLRKRLQTVRLYDEAFASLDGIKLLRRDLEATAPFNYVIKVENGRRDALMAYLKEKGVDSGVHYIPNHLHPFFEPFARTPLPATEQVWKEILTLPLYYDMGDADLARVIGSVGLFFDAGREKAA